MSMPDERVYITDCEGPISKNDNAFELASKIVPDGDNLFGVLSRYDDVLADVVKKRNYNPGYTLKLIGPFLKAFGATEESMREYSSKNIKLVPGAQQTLNAIRSFMPTYIVSTSYEQYIESLCKEVDFPSENTYSTKFRLDRFEIRDSERSELEKMAREIASMDVMDIPPSNKLSDFSEKDKNNVNRLDEMIWKEIQKMRVGRILKEVKPVGGYEKSLAVLDISRKLGIPLSEVMYVGDSITDIDAFGSVRKSGGLTVSFNGNNYAVREAEIGVTSPTTDIMEVIALDFSSHGKDGVLKSVERHPRVEVIDDNNREEFSKHSSRFRKTVRGEAIGKLG